MSKRMSILLVVATIISGLIGGGISGRIFAAKPAVSEEIKQGKVLTVEELRVVDKKGKLIVKIGEFQEDPLQLQSVTIKRSFNGLVVYDSAGRESINLGFYSVSGPMPQAVIQEQQMPQLSMRDLSKGVLDTYTSNFWC